MRDQQATDFEIGWLAGIVDGEGWLGLSVSSRPSAANQPVERLIFARPELRIGNTDPAIIDRAIDILRKIGINPYRRSVMPPGKRRLMHECSCKHMTGVGTVLHVIHEQLTGNKQERSSLILEFIALRQSNPGIENPVYNGGVRGRFGPRRIRPYTEQELALVEACRLLQNPGASEATRETQSKAAQELRKYTAKAWAAHDAESLPAKIWSSPQGDLFGD